MMFRKIALWTLAAVISLFAAGATVMAASSLKLMVNGQVLNPPVAPRITNGTTLVPVRALAEALGANVGWDAASNTVTVDLPHSPQTDTAAQRRIALLESAVQPSTPDDAVSTWAKGVKMRNGALQYAVYSPSLRDSRKSELEKLNWVTGTSSPWAAHYQIGDGVKKDDSTYVYKVQFDWRSSADINKPLDWSKIPSVSVTVKKFGDYWLIAELPQGM